MTLVSFVVSFINIGWNGWNGYYIWSTDSTNYTKSFSHHQMNQMNLIAGVMIIWLIWFIWWLFFQTLFVPFVLSVGKIIICCWINFCPLSPKPTNSYNSLIIIDIRCNIPIKSPKIHLKSLLLYINFANLFSFPFSKLPDPNDVVSSINAYGVNSWHLVSYEGWEKATDKRKNTIKCLIPAIYYIFFVLCARIGI